MEGLGVKALVTELKKEIVRLKNESNPENDELFQQIIYSILKTGLMNKDEMANGLLVSKPTIDRWGQGRNLPHRFIRGRIYEYLLDRIESHLSAEITVLKEVLEKPIATSQDLVAYLSQCLRLEVVDINELAQRMEVAPSTVRRWANGTAKLFRK